MIKKIFLVIFIIIICSNFAYGSNSRFGIGIIIGAPTGISAKYYINDKHAIDLGIGWSLSKNVVRLHSDYLFHDYKLINDAINFPIIFNFGGGVKLLFSDSIEIGFRIPLGLLYNFQKPPIDIFFEVVPILELIPDTKLGLDAALGARFYFGKE